MIKKIQTILFLFLMILAIVGINWFLPEENLEGPAKTVRWTILFFLFTILGIAILLDFYRRQSKLIGKERKTLKKEHEDTKETLHIITTSMNKIVFSHPTWPPAVVLELIHLIIPIMGKKSIEKIKCEPNTHTDFFDHLSKMIENLQQARNNIQKQQSIYKFANFIYGCLNVLQENPQNAKEKEKILELLEGLTRFVTSERLAKNCQLVRYDTPYNPVLHENIHPARATGTKITEIYNFVWEIENDRRRAPISL